MPHRTTYIFPRQFPETGPITNPSLKSEVLHEKNKISKATSSSRFMIDGDGERERATDGSDHVFSHHTALLSERHRFGSCKSDRSHHGKKKKQQLAAFVNWLVEKKTNSGGHVRLNENDIVLDDLLLPAPVKDVVDYDWRSHLSDVDFHHPITQQTGGGGGGIDRQISNESCQFSGGVRDRRSFSDRRRLSSDAGSSYAASLFSGTIATSSSANFYKDSMTEEMREEEEVVVAGNGGGGGGGGDDCRRNLVERWRESYYLQLTLAKRLTHQATIGDEPTLIQGRGYGGGGGGGGGGPAVTCYDAESVSYRLWV